MIESISTKALQKLLYRSKYESGKQATQQSVFKPYQNQS